MRRIVDLPKCPSCGKIFGSPISTFQSCESDGVVFKFLSMLEKGSLNDVSTGKARKETMMTLFVLFCPSPAWKKINLKKLPMSTYTTQAM